MSLRKRVSTNDTANTPSHQQSPNNIRTSATRSSMWWRCLHWLIAVVLVAVSAYALNSFVDAKRLEELRVAQLADDTLRQLRVPSSPTPLQVRCDVVGKRIGTFFHVPGAGCSWIYNAIPLWKLPQLVPGVEVCTFSRQGLPFSDGSPNNATDEAVELLVRQVLELILTQTTDRNSPLWISGHSYGGMQAALVAQRLIESGRTPKAVLLIDAAPLFAENGALQRQWEDVVRGLSTMASVLETIAALGIARLFSSQMLAMGAPTALDYIPTQYRDAYLYAVAAPSNYAGLRADFQRYFATAARLRRLIEDAPNAAPLLGDLPVEMLQASAARFSFVAQPVLDLLTAHDNRSIYARLSTRVNIQVIEGSDHQFVSNPAAVRSMLSAIVAIINR